MKKCVDIVVTYNRKALLKENITALLSQTCLDHDIMIIDNASTDGTKELVEEFKNPSIKYYNTGKNLGGAGGFSYGLKIACESGYKYSWIMDDDSIPERDALEYLFKKASVLKDNFSFLSSLVYWTDNNIFPMNFPRCDYKHIQEMPHYLIKEMHLLPITGGSFVGCFINNSLVDQIGLPIADFFIYGDDQEYTHRLKKIKPCYLDMDSSILHKAPSNKGADIATAPVDRISRFYFQSRNGMYLARKDKTVLMRYFEVIRRVSRIITLSPDHKIERIWMLTKGTISGHFYNPQIDYPFKAIDND